MQCSMTLKGTNCLWSKNTINEQIEVCMRATLSSRICQETDLNYLKLNHLCKDRRIDELQP